MAIQTANKQLRYIPLIFICLRIWGTFYFLFVQYGPAKGRDMFGDSLLIMKVSCAVKSKQVNFLIGR